MVILFVPGLGGGVSGRKLVNKNKIKHPPQHKPKIATCTETYFQNEGERRGKGKGKVGAPTKVTKPKLERAQVTLAPEAKSEEETGRKEDKTVRRYS